MFGRRRLGREQPVCRGAAQGGLKVNGLVEESVAEENHQGEETELEVVCFARCLCFVGADDEQREKDGKEAATDDIGGLHCGEESQW